jgi:hypothetical protein
MRLTGWELRLADEVSAARDKAFQWGAHDCATWAFDVRKALTGEDAAAAWRGKYKTEAGAARVLRKLKCQSVEDLARSILGDALPIVLFAQRGDIVLGGDERALGVCIGHSAVFLTATGWRDLPLRSCHFAWRV